MESTVDMLVNEQNHVIVLGTSGAGKSTLLNILTETDHFNSLAGMESDTERLAQLVVQKNIDGVEKAVCYFDTKGYRNSDEKMENQILKDFIKDATKIGYFHTVLFVVPEVKRFDPELV